VKSTGERPLPERAAANQNRFREYNERIEPHNAVHHWVDPPYADWICECADVTCVEPVRLTVAEYETVRADPTHFLVAPGDDHVVPEVERVVDRTERYWVVQKIGEAGEVSEALDPRESEVALHADQAAWNVAAPRQG
jgi:hypothetical protein